MSLILWTIVVAGGLVILGIALRRREAGETARGESHTTPRGPRRRSGGGCH